MSEVNEMNVLIVCVIALGLWKAYELSVKGIAKFERFQNDKINTSAVEYKKIGKIR